jgi:transcriptional regulator with XRE-family HTH domain
MTLAKRIQQARKDAGLTVDEAASQARISASYWQKLEAGQYQNPTMAVVVRIARSLQVSANRLVPLEEHDEVAA